MLCANGWRLVVLDARGGVLGALSTTPSFRRLGGSACSWLRARAVCSQQRFRLAFFRPSRSSAAVDYENLLDTSFNDSNRSVKSDVLPRWERKKLQKQASSKPCSNITNGDRFIPVRSGMELAKHQMRTANSSADDRSLDDAGHNLSSDRIKSVADDKKVRYASNLSSALLGVDDVKSSRILSYQDKAPVPAAGDTVGNLNILYSASAACAQGKSSAKLVSRHIPSAPSRILDAPDLMDDYYLNLVDWSASNWLAIALGQTVFLWNAGTGDIEELCSFDEGPNAHISSVKWVQEGGTHLAVGTSNGYTQLWDVNENKKVRSMGGHTDRVGALAWNRHLLTSGSRDTNIVHHDVRVARHDVATLSAHQQEVCGLAWSPDGETLASGANDNLLCLWDASRTLPRHRLTDHHAAVKALAWSPHERNLLASGAGTADRTIKFWNSTTGSLLNSIDTGSQVCALLWNPYEKEILSSHGYSRNQLSLYKYPSLAKIKDLEGHTMRVLHLACGPTGAVVSAAADETMRFWDVFAPPPPATAGAGAYSGGSSKVAGRSRGKAALPPHPEQLTSLAGTRQASWTMQIR